MKKVNVLFVAYQFPPLMYAGSFRPYKFVKYFLQNESNIHPVVVKLSPNSFSNVYEDPPIADNFKLDGLKIYDIESESLKKSGRIVNFLKIYLDIYKGSESKGIEKNFSKAFFEIIEKEKIDVVWVTCPPFSIGDLVRRLLKNTNIPYIADMRDAWALWISQPYGSRLHYMATKKAERKLLKESSAVVGVAKEQIEDFINNQKLPASKFHFIPNSFDFDIELLKDTTYSKKVNSLKIGYVGAFYYDPKTYVIQNTKWYKRDKHRKFYYWPRKEEWIYRTPYFFFRAINKMLKLQPDIEVKIRFAGHVKSWLIDMVKEFDLENYVHFDGYLNGKDLEDFYESNDLLLLTSVKVENGKDYCIASKSFDYIKAGKPILAFVKEGAQKNFLEKSQNAVIVDSDDLESGVNKLIELSKMDELNLKYKKKYLKKYSIKETSENLEKLILELSNKL